MSRYFCLKYLPFEYLVISICRIQFSPQNPHKNHQVRCTFFLKDKRSFHSNTLLQKMKKKTLFLDTKKDVKLLLQFFTFIFCWVIFEIEIPVCTFFHSQYIEKLYDKKKVAQKRKNTKENWNIFLAGNQIAFIIHETCIESNNKTNDTWK